jgi:hypothetical protein
VPKDTNKKVAKAKEVLSNADAFQQSVTGRSPIPATHIQPLVPPPTAPAMPAPQADVNSRLGNIQANSDLLSFNKC